MALPDLTPEQRAQALEKATQARRRRAEVKNALKARSMNLSEVLELADSDEFQNRTPVNRARRFNSFR